MKNLKFLSKITLLVLAMVALVFASCNRDEEKNDVINESVDVTTAPVEDEFQNTPLSNEEFSNLNEIFAAEVKDKTDLLAQELSEDSELVDLFAEAFSFSVRPVTSNKGFSEDELSELFENFDPESEESIEEVYHWTKEDYNSMSNNLMSKTEALANKLKEKGVSNQEFEKVLNKLENSEVFINKVGAKTNLYQCARDCVVLFSCVSSSAFGFVRKLMSCLNINDNNRRWWCVVGASGEQAFMAIGCWGLLGGCWDACTDAQNSRSYYNDRGVKRLASRSVKEHRQRMMDMLRQKVKFPQSKHRRTIQKNWYNGYRKEFKRAQKRRTGR